MGAARTADPLGGSYYVEALTDEIEQRALEMLAEIENRGLINAISSGYLEQLMDDHNIAIDRELREKQRILVGVNEFVPAAETQPKRFTFDRTNTKAHIERFIALKQSRDNGLLHDKLQALYNCAKSGANFHQAMIDALIADGSIGEVWGTVRMAYGYQYDPFNTLQAPFELKR